MVGASPILSTRSPSAVGKWRICYRPGLVRPSPPPAPRAAAKATANALTVAMAPGLGPTRPTLRVKASSRRSLKGKPKPRHLPIRLPRVSTPPGSVPSTGRKRVCASRLGNAPKRTAVSFTAALFPCPTVRPVGSRTLPWSMARRPTEPCFHIVMCLRLCLRLTLSAPLCLNRPQLHLLRLWYRLGCLRTMSRLAPVRLCLRRPLCLLALQLVTHRLRCLPLFPQASASFWICLRERPLPFPMPLPN